MHNDWVGSRGHHESLGCVAMLHQPSGRNGPSPQRRKYTKKYDKFVPSSSPASRPSGVTIVGRTTATATLTTSHNHCAQAGRNTIGTWLCTRPRHRDCVDMPDAGLHPHRQLWTNNTHTAKAIALCALQRPTCPQSSAIERHPTGMYPAAAQRQWGPVHHLVRSH